MSHIREVGLPFQIRNATTEGVGFWVPEIQVYLAKQLNKENGPNCTLQIA